MGQDRARHLGAWLLTIAFELAAGIMSQWQEWTLVTILFWTGGVALAVGYLPDIKATFQAGKIFGWEFLKQAAISFVLICAIWFATVFCATVIEQWSIPTPSLFQPEGWAIQNRAFVEEKPTELAAYFSKYTEITATRVLSRYIGKWYAITGAVDDVTSYQDEMGGAKFSMKDTHFVSLKRQQNALPLMMLEFEDKWEPEVDVLNKGDRISAYCQIRRINSFSITLDHCQLVHR